MYGNSKSIGVWVFEDSDLESLETKINEYLADMDVTVLDIKFSHTCIKQAEDGMYDVSFAAMVIFSEK